MTHSYHLKPFDPFDAEALADLHRRAILAVSPRFYSKAALESWAHGIDPAAYVRSAAERETFRVASSPSGQILGFVSYLCEGVTGVIAGLYTAPEAQGRGIARALLVNAEQDLLEQGIRRFKVESSLCAMAFYEHQGYQAQARALRQTRGGLEIGIWRMEKLV